MWPRLAVAGVLALVASTQAACKKSSRALEWDEAARSPDMVDHNRQAAGHLVAPALFASIPADTPYVFAAFDPIPPEYWHRTFAQVGPALERVLRQAAVAPADEDGPSPATRVVLEVLGADLSAATLERYGLSASPRFAIYGLGPMPVVRVEISDPGRLTETIERIAARVGAAFERRTEAGRTYWVVDEPKRTVTFGVVGDQLVASWGNAAAVARAIPVLFGHESVGDTMADGKVLAQLASVHGLSGFGLGYLDVVRLTELVTGRGHGIHADIAATYAGTASRSTERCRTALGAVATELPRVVVGYDELTSAAASMTAVFEVSDAVTERLRSIARDVPGLSARFPTQPLIAIGTGFDADEAVELIANLRGLARDIASACEVSGRFDADSELYAKQLFAPPAGIGGAMLVIQRAQLSSFGLPEGIEGYAVIAVDDAPARLANMTDISEQLAHVDASGRFRRIPLGRFEQFLNTLYVAAHDDAILIAVGDKSRVRLERSLESDDPSPLFVMAYDANQFARLTGSLLDLTSILSGEGTPVDTANPAEGDANLGQIALSVRLTDAGVVVHGRVGTAP